MARFERAPNLLVGFVEVVLLHFVDAGRVVAATASVKDDRPLGDPACAEALCVETHLRGGKVTTARATLEEGTWPELDLSPATAEIIGALDGRRTLRELSAPRDAVAACRELLELGALRLVVPR